MNFASKLFQKQRYVVLLAVLVFFAALYALVPGDAPYWLGYWWMFPIAFFIAVVVNTAGLSGASMFVPFFILVFPLIAGVRLNPIDTVKLGLITESFGLSSSAMAFFAFGLVDVKLAKKAIVRAMPFVLAGVFFVFFIPKSVLYVIISAMLLLAVFLIIYGRDLKEKREAELKSDNISTNIEDGEKITIVSKDKKTYRYCITKADDKKRFIGYGAGGIFQGAAGFGIGELGIISMMLTHIPTRIAIGTSHFIVATTAVAASVAHFALAPSLSAGAFPWNIPAMTVPAVILGGQIAPYVAAKLSSRYLERFVSVLFVIISAALMILALG